VTVTIKARVVTVKGPRGELTKQFKHIRVDMEVKEIDRDGKKVKVIEFKTYLNTYKQSAILHTISSLILNMITGVTKGYRYKMHIVKKHFPIEVAIESNRVEIGRFLGGKDLKVVKLLEGVSVTRNDKNAEELWFESIDLVALATTCSHVYQSCTVYDKDRRKFLDGIYVNEKNTIDD